MATTLFPTINLCKGSYNKRKHTDISTTTTTTTTADTTLQHNDDNNNDDDDKDMTIISLSQPINRYPSRPNDLPNTTQEDETMTRTGIDSAMTYVKAISSADKILLSERLLKLLSSSSSNSSNNNNYSNSSSDRLSNVTVIKPVIPASFDLSYTYSSFYLLGRYYHIHTIIYYVLLYM